MRSGSARGKEIGRVIDEGKIVTSETTVDLLRDAMAACDGGAFLIDGFPRSLSNLRAFEERMGPCAFMLFLELSAEAMEARLLKRGDTSGRSDDNKATIAKRMVRRRDSHTAMLRVDCRRSRSPWF